LKRPVQLVLSSLLLAISTPGQQVASIDLRQPVTQDPAKIADSTENPGGCEKDKMSVGFADGVTRSDDGELRPIRVALISLSSQKLKAGTEIEATVQFLNSGKKEIQIPWSTDWETTITGQDPNAHTWQVGEFRVHLKGKQHSAELQGLSKILYASTFVPGTSLSLKPGQWISAQINFTVEVARPAYMQMDDGEAELSVEWFQTVRSRDEKDCRVMLGYYPFRGFYQQENASVPVQVEKKEPEENKKASSQLESKRLLSPHYAEHPFNK
jgi:hypothetical protein